MSDLENLLAMGFDPEKAELAVKENGGCKSIQGAIDWLDKNQDKTIEEIKEEAGTQNEDGDGPALKDGEVPKSLLCNDCGKKFRSHAQAEFHASKTEHTNFSESTDEIAPLSEQEKKERLQELLAKRDAKKKELSAQDTIERKRNEQIRLKATKEQSDAKEELAKKEQIKEAQLKRQEKLADVEAKKRIQAKIAADKEERRFKAEREKAARSDQAVPSAAVAAPPPAGVPVSKPANSYTETRLRLQTASGTVQKNFPVETTLFEVAHAIASDNGVQAQSFTTNYPKKTYERLDFGMSLKEAGMVPSAVLIVK